MMNKNAADIILDIEFMVLSGSEYIDAILEYSRLHDIEVEVLASLVKNNAKLKARVQKEALKLHLIKE